MHLENSILLLVFLADKLQRNLPGHTQMHPGTLYHAMSLCGLRRDLSSPSFSMSCLISPLSVTASPKKHRYPDEVTVFGHFSIFSPSLSSTLPFSRQLWIIKCRIRGYFLPTQTVGGWAGGLAVGLIPLSTRNTTKSHCSLSSSS